MKDTILLLNPPAPNGTRWVIRDFYCSFSPKAEYYWPPQDLLALSGLLRKKYDVRVVDAVAMQMNAELCLEVVATSGASIVIFSTGSASFKDDLEFMKRVRSRCDARLVATSAMLHSFPFQQLSDHFPFIDAAISDFTDISSVDFICKDVVSAGSTAGFSLGSPAYESFISDGLAFPFFRGQPFAIMINSFGCKFACGFCVSGTFQIKYRDLKEVLADCHYVHGLGVRNIFFTDPLFTGDACRVREFCRGVEGLGLRWICNAHVTTIQDADMLAEMKRAGCLALLIGVESGNDKILSQYHKGTNTRQIREVFSLCKKQGINTLAYFIIGLPGESREEVMNTIRFAQQLECDLASFGLPTPDEGTALRAEALKKGWFRSKGMLDSFDSSGCPVLQTDSLSLEESRGLLKEAYRAFYSRPGFLARKFFEIRSWKEFMNMCRSGWSLLKKNS